MYCTENTPEYTIDLGKSAKKRWKAVMRDDVEVALRLAEEAQEDFREHLSPALFRAITLGMGVAYKMTGGLYTKEMSSIAEAMGISTSEAIALNCTYELSHMSSEVMLYGCTAAVKHIRGMGMVHARNMDWPLEEIGNATRIFNFVKPNGHKFVTVGMSGFVGVISGMVPGAYSVTINWAPPQGKPRMAMGPAFLLREVLSTCRTYEDAVRELSNSPLATPVFYTVCGAKQGQACVIERTCDAYGIRPAPSRGSLAQANHHVLPEFAENNEDLKEMEGGTSVYRESRRREKTLKGSLDRCSAPSIDQIGRCLDKAPVYNEDSFQQMVFVPASGELKVWRCVD